MYLVPLSGLQSIESIQSKEAVGKDMGTHALVPFQDMLQQAIQNLGETQAAADADAYGLVLGDVSDLHNVTIRSAMQQTAVEMTVQLASRAVSAYKEVLQMQI